MIWLFYYSYNWFRKAVNYVAPKIKLGISLKSLIRSAEIKDIYASHRRIKEIILEGKPALIARFGSNEARCTAEAIGIKLGILKGFHKNTLHSMHMNAGVFPAGATMMMRFAELSCEAASKVDLLGYWGSFMQDYLTRYVCHNSVWLTNLGNLEPYNSNEPWTVALKGKRVLVIHPFKSTIESQYKKRELLFQNPDILPEFQLSTIQAVQTIAGEKDSRFSNWEEALNYMHEEAMKYDFDVAIIGCGAYGMPLAAKIKDSGKIAIHLGGATQLLFGIKGGRWDHHPLSRLYNDHWVRPLQEETPQLAQQVEGACYW